MLAKDVFTPGGYPTHTLVDEHIRREQKTLAETLDTGGLIISLGGPSKAGKTVFVENVIGRGNLVHVTGAGVDSPAKLWMKVFDIIGTPVQHTQTSGTAFTGQVSGKVSAGAAIPLVAKAAGEVGTSGSWTQHAGSSEVTQHDLLQLLIRELKETKLVIFVDDFHYIAEVAKAEIAKQIKEAVRLGVRIICASVPYHSDDVLRANADLRGRVATIDLNYWTVDILVRIAQKGFDALHVGYDQTTLVRYAQEAAGSPQLMQSMCLNICHELGVAETDDSGVRIPTGGDFLKRVCSRTAALANYKSTVEKMMEGPKTRGTERTPYNLRIGTIADVYPIVMRAISSNPPELTFRYQNLQKRIEEVCAKESPSGSSVTGACHHLAQIANSGEMHTIVEWDSANDVLDIRDPYLLFYLRWSFF